MESLWRLKEQKNEINPLSILQFQAKQLNELTKGLVSAEVIAVSPKSLKDIADSRNTFLYNFSICSRFIENYSLKLFQVSFSINIYPLKIRVLKDIADELAEEMSEFNIKNYDEFMNRLERILNSEYSINVINGLRSIAEAKVDGL
jgi:uncharacterized protein YdhG (YjbR/CyaY superfamily)